MIKKVKKGFTLIELVVVIAVIAILSAVSVVAYVGITNSAKKSSAEQKASQIVTVIRAGVLASDKGYTEQDFGTTEGAKARYTVTIDGKKLTFTALNLSGWTPLQMINDMLEELEETEELVASKVDNEGEATKIGVLIDGKTAEADGEKAYAYQSF